MKKNIWYKQLGFYNNPFSIKPGAYFNDLFGLKDLIKKVNYNISTGKVVLVEGTYGNGKSTLLRGIIHKFGGKGKVVYFSCNRIEDRLDVERLINGNISFIGKLFKVKPKELILLLDEAQWLSKEDLSRLVRYYRSKYFNSIVLVSPEFNQENLPDSFDSMLQKFKLDEVSDEEAVRLIRKRVGQLPYLNDELIKYVFNKSGKNVRTLLKNCELLCKHAFENDLDEVTKEVADRLLFNEETEEELKVEEEKPSSEKSKVDENKVNEDTQEELKVEEETPGAFIEEDSEKIGNKVVQEEVPISVEEQQKPISEPIKDVPVAAKEKIVAKNEELYY